MLSVVGLTTACKDDEIVAKTGYYDDPIATIGNEDIYNNTMNIVLDGIREGSLASDVLDEVLYQYAVSVIGGYNKVLTKEGTTLKEAAKDVDSDVCAEFIKSHKAYWDEDRENKDAAVTASEKARVTAKWNTIEDRIAEKMYSKISGGSYSKRNIFSEKDFLYSLRSSMNAVADPTTATNLYKGLLYTEVEDKEVFTGHGSLDALLNRENYQENAALTEDESNNKITYVEDELIPDIYRQLLVEQYLLDENYNSLGRSYARKVNVIAIANNTDYPKAAPYLMDYFVKNVVSKGQVAKDKVLDTFKSLSNVWKGIDLTAEQKIWIENCGGFEPATAIDGTSYYKGTKYGAMMESYDKITSKTTDINYDSSAESEFTGSNTYTKEVGKKIKEDNIRLEDYTTTGWYIKNGGLSTLPSAITNRLFNISVANAVNDKDAADRWNSETSAYAVPENESQYVAKINGANYLKVSSTQQGADPMDDILFYDNDSSTYYIVEVEEAVSSSRFAKNSSENYKTLRGADVMEEFVNEVVKIVAQNDSYKTLSNKYWLEKAGCTYHDTVVYDYFKSNYPELFEDEK